MGTTIYAVYNNSNLVVEDNLTVRETLARQPF